MGGGRRGGGGEVRRMGQKQKRIRQKRATGLGRRTGDEISKKP